MAGIMSANLGLADMNIVRAADEAPNLALGTEVTASDAESVNPAENAVDGDASTHWATNQSKMNDQWIELDLKVPTEVHQVKILWERHTEEKRIIKISRNGKSKFFRKTILGLQRLRTLTARILTQNP